jgi:hypothetical protein
MAKCNFLRTGLVGHSKYLAAMGQRRATVIEATAAILTLISVAIFAAHALDAYRTG